MMKTLKNALLVLAAVAMTSTYLIAQPPGGRGGPPGGFPQDGPPPNHPVVEALDADGDHEISASEIENAIAVLKKLDTNGDGKLTEADRPEGTGPQRGGRPPRAEGEEFGGPGGQRGGRPPRDGGEGLGGPSDQRGGRPPRDGGEGPGGPGDQRGGRPPRDGGEGPGGPGGQRSDGGESASDFATRILAFDKNEDGMVTTDELPSRMHSVMQRHDTNKDGSLDKTELDKIATAAGSADRGAQGGPGGGERGPGGPGGGRGPGGPGGPPSPERFIEHAMSFDADGDGKLSTAELKKFAEEMPPPPPGGGPPAGR